MPHVIVFGVDGVRLDTLAAAHTPRIDAVAEAGFFSSFEVSSAAPVLSGPCWTTVATGMWPEAHGVFGNKFAGHRLAVFPDFLTLAKRAGLRTYAALTWAPLATATSGGPLFTDPTRLSYADGEALGHAEADQLVVDDATRTLSTGAYDAAFVYIGAPDEVAHAVGTGPEYLAAVERADAQIGQVLDAVAHLDDLTVIVVTDHGHRDEGGHGGRTTWEKQAWIAASGPSVPADAGRVCHADVAPHVLAVFGQDVSTMTGVPFGRR
ncbi:alkaline phosphatase family protein [Hamadaea sp. NPDC051192]|uniref:alkaline phosphatase family protein n=1 Tax=Hamadaea sp. NPDC051192 TaxID=3154940 RepID=UPI00343CD835